MRRYRLYFFVLLFLALTALRIGFPEWPRQLRGELWVFGETISRGMSIEIAKAKRKDKTIRFFTTDCKEVSR